MGFDCFLWAYKTSGANKQVPALESSCIPLSEIVEIVTIANLPCLLAVTGRRRSENTQG